MKTAHEDQLAAARKDLTRNEEMRYVLGGLEVLISSAKKHGHMDAHDDLIRARNLVEHYRGTDLE